VPCAAFESDWTDLSLEVKKNLLFFIMRTQKALHISALDVFHLSVESFVAVDWNNLGFKEMVFCLLDS
jgi:hypothetical protein